MPVAAPRARTAKRTLPDPHLARTDKYIRALASGRIYVSDLTRLAAKRHLDDLERAKSADFPYEFDRTKAGRALRFCHLFTHVKGDLAGQPLEIHEWGCFFIASIFGWRTKATGSRRFREALAWVPRGNSKSTILSAASLYAAFGEGGQADVFSLATTKEQAGICWGDAASMLRSRENVRAKLGVEIYKTALSQPGTNSSFRRLASKDTSLDGLNVSWATMDELHEVSRPLYDVIKTALGKRANSILVSISTAGMDAASFGREMYDYCRNVLRGTIRDELTFALIYEVPEGADPYTEKSQRAANPMFGLSVRPEILRAAAEKAKRFASHRPAYLVKHCNVWVTAALAYFDLDRFNALADPSLKREAFAESQCIMGLDLAGTSAFTAKALVFVRDLPHANPEEAARGETQRHYYAFLSYWLNRRAIEASATNAYANWVDAGWVEVAGEDVTDFTPAKQEIVFDIGRFQVPQIRCDPHLINQLVTLVQADAPNAPFIEHPQRTQFLSPPMKEMNRAILEGRFHHDGNPVFAWNIGNVEAKEDANENVFPLKSGGKASTNYIDGVSAVLNAIGGAMTVAPPTYTADRGLFFVDFDSDE